MPVKSIPAAGATKLFLGKSSDTKPADGLQTGSIFFETDTALAWRWDGVNWNLTEGADLSRANATALILVGLQSLGDRMAAEFRALKQTIASSLYVETQ